MNKSYSVAAKSLNVPEIQGTYKFDQTMSIFEIILCKFHCRQSRKWDQHKKAKQKIKFDKKWNLEPRAASDQLQADLRKFRTLLLRLPIGTGTKIPPKIIVSI